LDNILAAGYSFIKTTQGRPAADAIGIPYWKAFAQCDGYEACIAKRQFPDVTQVRIMSLHKSKGLSSPVVIIAGCIEGFCRRHRTRTRRPPRSKPNWRSSAVCCASA
jgi:hypothetical protein